MSGHSKWHSIKHKKAITDAKRGKIFTKIIREITVSVRTGGKDINANPRLRLAMEKAKEANMPNDNVERAIKKGAGELSGVNYEDITYEGYGPEAIALMIDVLTDNRNRTVSELRKIFSRNEGNLAESGSVAWMFERRGVILVHIIQPKDEQEILEIALAQGADDVETQDESIIIYSSIENMEPIKQALIENNQKVEQAEVQQVAKNKVEIDDSKMEKIMRLIELIEDHDDVQTIATNIKDY